MGLLYIVGFSSDAFLIFHMRVFLRRLIDHIKEKHLMKIAVWPLLV